MNGCLLRQTALVDIVTPINYRCEIITSMEPILELVMSFAIIIILLHTGKQTLNLSILDAVADL